MGRFFSDHWKAYAELFPADKLKQNKVLCEKLADHQGHKPQFMFFCGTEDFAITSCRQMADKLKQTKAETYTVEGYNCRIRHYLARFRRKGLCYSKSESMIVNSLNLLFLKLNNQLSIVI